MPFPEFEKAAADVRNLKKKPSDAELLTLYGLFKQATEGDNSAAKPGIFSIKEKYKWQAWTDVQGTSKQDAEKKYTAFVNELKEKHGFDG